MTTTSASDTALDVAAETLTTHGCPLGGHEPQCIAESIPHIVWIALADGTTTYFNRQGTDYTGFPREANYGWDWVNLVHPDDAELARAGWAHATTTETPYALEYRIRRHDGAFRWHAFRALPVRGYDGKISTWIGTATDIDEQKQLELALRDSERTALESLRLLESISAATPVGFKLVDRDFRVISINDNLAHITGRSIDDHLGRTVAELWPELWTQLLLREAYEGALRGETVVNVEVTGQSAEQPGRTRYWLASYYPVRIGGEIIGVGNVVIDITERKEAEEAHKALTRNAIDAIAATVEARDPYTAGHQHRVADLSAAIAVEIGLSPASVEGIRLGANIHDLGKIGVPAEILSRPSRLNALEYELVKTHTRVGYDIVKDIVFPWPIADMILHHHERLDGSGYPDGLRGGEIGIEARIIAVADVVEAMASHRPYRPSMGIDAALTEIATGRAILFDPTVVDTCLTLFREGRVNFATA
jgi:PAS domain S-box-containing protein